MSNRIQHVGLDVDDNSFNGHVRTGMDTTDTAFKTKANLSSLIKKLESLSLPKHNFKICYEAGYLGYSLQRQLQKKGYNCEVIAPSLIPKKPGEKVKTDRIDSKKLTEYYQKGELTAVNIPDEEEEKVRDLIRSRKFIQDQLKRVKVHILATCRRNGINYKVETKKANANYWTGPHLSWLRKKIKGMEKTDTLKINLLLLLNQAENIEQQVGLYDKEISQIAKEEKYKKKVEALSCYRGIAELSAMTIIAELGDIRRFAHPKNLTSYSGMDIEEYSSGGKHKRYGITKMGNGHIRKTVVEACQNVCKIPKISNQLQQRREGVEIGLIKIADRCMRRLYKKGSGMLHRGKIKNKIKVACARELLGFIWESLNAVA